MNNQTPFKNAALNTTQNLIMAKDNFDTDIYMFIEVSNPYDEESRHSEMVEAKNDLQHWLTHEQFPSSEPELA